MRWTSSKEVAKEAGQWGLGCQKVVLGSVPCSISVPRLRFDHHERSAQSEIMTERRVYPTYQENPNTFALQIATRVLFYAVA